MGLNKPYNMKNKASLAPTHYSKIRIMKSGSRLKRRLSIGPHSLMVKHSPLKRSILVRFQVEAQKSFFIFKNNSLKEDKS